MNVEEFLKEALTSIVRGITAAQQDEEVGSMVGRKPSRVPDGSGINYDGLGNCISIVTFDLATTVDDKASGGGGIKVVGFNAGGQIEQQKTTVSRISFSIPVGVPVPKQQALDKNAKNQKASEAMRRLGNSLA